MINKLVVKFFMWYTKCTKEELAARYEMNRLLGFSKFKSYLYTLLDKR